MENTAGQKKYGLKKCLFYSLMLYTIISIAYILIVALTVENKSIDVSGFANILLKRMIFLLLFSFMFGYSMMIFNLKKIPSAAKWTLHILSLYAATLVTFLLMSSGNEDPSQKVLFIFISTLLFALVYSISALIMYIYKRKRRI